MLLGYLFFNLEGIGRKIMNYDESSIMNEHSGS